MTYAALELGKKNIVVVEAVKNRTDLTGGALRAGFSNIFGDISAPGVAIMSTFASQPYNAISGTSMASPHVAGLMSFLLAIDPTLTNAQVREAITSTSVAVARVRRARVQHEYRDEVSRADPAGEPWLE